MLGYHYFIYFHYSQKIIHAVQSLLISYSLSELHRDLYQRAEFIE